MIQQPINLEMKGVGQALANLKTLEFKARRSIVSKAVRKGNAILIKEVRRQAPYRTGALKKSARAKVKHDKHRGAVVGSIYFTSTKAQKRKGMDAWYAHIVIGGSQPHAMPRHRTARMAFGGGVYSSVMHPGTRPNPFVETATRIAAQRAVDAFRVQFNEQLLTETRKLPT